MKEGNALTHIYEARIRAAKRTPILNDRRSLYYDEIGISLHEISKLENDSDYIAQPSTYVKLIEYYNDHQLSQQICEHCIIKRHQQILLSDNKELKYYAPNSKSSFQKRYKKIEKTLSNKACNKSVFYNARLRFSLKCMKFVSRNEISNLTGIAYKRLTQIEKPNHILIDFQEAYLLFKLYDYSELGTEICSICPISVNYKCNFQIKKHRT